MDFRSIYTHGFLRVAACTALTAIAEPASNAASILAIARDCDRDGVGLAVFPELSVSGYALEDLFLQDALHEAVGAALDAIVAGSRDLLPVLVVGAPLRHRHRLYNSAVVIHRGAVLGVVPKSFLPNYREFYEKRHFAAGAGLRGETIRAGGAEAPFGTDLLFAAGDVPGFVLGVEVCEDLWVPAPPSGALALGGATVIANLSGSPITVGRARSRNLLCQATSARCLCAYVYAAAGAGESTTDLSWDGQTVVYESGVLLAEGERFAAAGQATMADVDLDLLRQERISTGSFDDNARAGAGTFRTVPFRLGAPDADVGFRRRVERFPFVPSDRALLEQDCYEAYNIQVAGLKQRLKAIGVEHITVGVSGGLDSTHALIVAAKAFDLLGLPRTNILAYTMPGFATGDDTRSNAHRLMAALGVTAHELDIRPAAEQMLRDLGHPYAEGRAQYDVTFENVQAGLRTDYLFRLANHQNAIVLGTGDLSELALGWCTYGVGDQMSHYNVNAGVPKTLIQHLIRWVVSSRQLSGDADATLLSILDTEISPELVPVEAGSKPQSTEERVGPYELQDFNLFYTLRYGFKPSKIAFLSLMAWGDVADGHWPEGFPADRRRAHDLAHIRKWLRVFVQRFFGFSQFKRSALPNGPKVSAGGALSPRGDWRAPSDGNARMWLEELERNVPEG
ncbi:NAD(+) synthase [Lichenibacterium dinghuense]|uniref:NAD(+) synthase n=1 Tax=Lichenibacterium dinghuense TaxID=2895977 RepID=UPI001F018393|nr:NAD(+) synthase [Lichenibacterium sp. 6Y81]